MVKTKKHILINTIILCVLGLLVFLGINLKDSMNPDTKAAKNVVKNYFLYCNEKNKEKAASTFTKDLGSDSVWDISNLYSIKIISIKEEKDDTDKESYLTSGNGKNNGVKKENVKIFRVKYDIKFKDDSKTVIENGKYVWWYTVIRKDKNSPWLIDDFGVA